jgi:hypothetical protein
MDPQSQPLGSGVAHQSQIILPAEVRPQPINGLLLAADIRPNRPARPAAGPTRCLVLAAEPQRQTSRSQGAARACSPRQRGRLAHPGAPVPIWPRHRPLRLARSRRWLPRATISGHVESLQPADQSVAPSSSPVVVRSPSRRKSSCQSTIRSREVIRRRAVLRLLRGGYRTVQALAAGLAA